MHDVGKINALHDGRIFKSGIYMHESDGSHLVIWIQWEHNNLAFIRLILKIFLSSCRGGWKVGRLLKFTSH